MKNWRDYVGVQNNLVRPLGVVNPTDVSIFYLSATRIDGGGARIWIENTKIAITDLLLSDEEVGDEVERLLYTFLMTVPDRMISIERAKFEIAKNSGRGSALTNFDNVWFYKGLDPFDCPIIVAEYQNRFAIFEHPSFQNYGFRVVADTRLRS